MGGYLDDWLRCALQGQGGILPTAPKPPSLCLLFRPGSIPNSLFIEQSDKPHSKDVNKMLKEFTDGRCQFQKE